MAKSLPAYRLGVGTDSKTQEDCPRPLGSAPALPMFGLSPAYQRNGDHPASRAIAFMKSTVVVTFRGRLHRVCRSNAASAKKSLWDNLRSIGRHEKTNLPPGRTTRRASLRYW